MPRPPLREPAGLGQFLRTWLISVPLAIWLISSLLVCNLVQMASLVLLPLSRGAFRKVNREAADWWWGMAVSLSRSINGARLVVTGDVLPTLENVVVVANHQEMPDITFLMLLARTKGRLGDLKWFVKDALKYVPGVGWGMVFLDCLFVKRDWTADAASIDATFSRVMRDRVPLWLINFPEGTRITPAKIASSRAYAAKQGLRPPEHVLIPRTKGFVASVQGLRGHIDAVYDITIGYERGVPNLWQYVKGNCSVAHLHLHRVPAHELPETDEQLSSWLMQRFTRKDQLLDYFYTHGVFPEDHRGGTE